MDNNGQQSAVLHASVMPFFHLIPFCQIFLDLVIVFQVRLQSNEQFLPKKRELETIEKDTFTHRSLFELVQVGLFCPEGFHVGKRVRLSHAEANEEDAGSRVARLPSFRIFFLPCCVPPSIDIRDVILFTGNSMTDAVSCHFFKSVSFKLRVHYSSKVSSFRSMSF